MKKLFKTIETILAISLIFSFASSKSFGQETYLSLLLNTVNSNLNYGRSNSTLRSFKKDVRGSQVGVAFQAGISQGFSVVTEAYFMMKGGILKPDNPITTNRSTLRLYSVELPILTRFHAGRIYFNSGPYVAYTVAGRMQTAGSTTFQEESTSLSFDDKVNGFNRWDMGMLAGAGYIIHGKKTRYALELRYSHGLINISRDVERYNRALNLSMIIQNKWRSNPLAKRTI